MPSDRDSKTTYTGGRGGATTELENEDTVRTTPLSRAVRDTQQAVRGTSDRVESLRYELGGRIDQLDGKVDGLAVSSAKVEGQVGTLVEELRAARTIRVSAVQAVLEVEKTGQIAKVEEAAAERKFKRQRELKIVGIAASLATALATLITLLASRC